MDKNKTDVFEGIKKPLLQEDNFFVNKESSKVFRPEFITNEAGRRLNDYDFNLLKEDSYKEVSDDLFKLEYKISKTEAEIKNLDIQIQLAKDINNEILIEDLTLRQSILKEDFEVLLAMYNDKSLSAKITDKVFNFFGNKTNNSIKEFKSKINLFSESFLQKLPKPIASVIELKKSLAKLENINKSVDELMSLKIPYGENIDKYSQLSQFIIKANSIQAEISNYIKTK